MLEERYSTFMAHLGVKVDLNIEGFSHLRGIETELLGLVSHHIYCAPAISYPNQRMVS
jgi:hypothetical protein